MFRFRKATSPEKATVAAPSAVGGAARQAIRLKVMRPEKFSDAPLIADALLSGETVVIHPEGMEREALRHLLDFLSGVTYAIDGNMKRLGDGVTFLVTPAGVPLAEAEAEEAVRSSAPAAPVPPPPAAPTVTDPVAAMFSSVGDDD
ncbi:MAG: cell division protein SepF [Clostridia bacterium]|nr:cell division protein SepF [Clostridia bacterium]